MVVCKITNTWASSSPRNVTNPKCLERKCFHNDNKFLGAVKSTEQSWLSNPAVSTVFAGIVIRWKCLVLQCPKDCPNPRKSLASHMISKGKSQSGLTIIVACGELHLEGFQCRFAAFFRR
ncbi:hypothetical protein Tco_1516760 [Tanacetum coccineum]